MKTLNVILSLLALVCVAHPASAAPKTPRVPSAVERESLHATLNLEPIGLLTGNYLGFVTGVSAGFFLEPNLLLRASLHTSKSCLDQRCSYGYNAGGVTVQSFVTNSFYLEAGVAQEQNIEHVVNTDYHESSNSRRYAFSYRTVNESVVFAVGQQWQWRTFTLGARWLAVSQPLANTSAEVKSLKPQYAVGDEEQKKLQSLKTVPHVVLANLVLGWSF